METPEVPLTRDDLHRVRKAEKMFVSRAVVKSKAFFSLKNAASTQVYMIFLSKCQWLPVQGARARRKRQYTHANNGEIQFSYKEAKEKFGISTGRFTRAIDELVRVGLIDIAKSGFGLHKDVTLYAVSERWKQYGTSEFQHAERPKRPGLGFRKGNKLGKNAKIKSTVNGEC